MEKFQNHNFFTFIPGHPIEFTDNESKGNVPVVESTQSAALKKRALPKVKA